MKNYMRLRAKDFHDYAHAPLSWHEWMRKEESRAQAAGDQVKREAYSDQMEPAHSYGRPMIQLLDGTWVPK